MVDSFLLLTLARTGDQLQGIKKGVLELADVIAVNKADGPHERDARSAARELAGALRLLQPAGRGLDPARAHLQRPRGDRPGHRLGAAGAAPRGPRRRPAGWRPSAATSRWTGRGPWSTTSCCRPAARAPGVAALAPDLEQQVRDGRR